MYDEYDDNANVVYDDVNGAMQDAENAYAEQLDGYFEDDPQNTSMRPELGLCGGLEDDVSETSFSDTNMTRSEFELEVNAAIGGYEVETNAQIEAECEEQEEYE